MLEVPRLGVSVGYTKERGTNDKGGAERVLQAASFCMFGIGGLRVQA